MHWGGRHHRRGNRAGNRAQSAPADKHHARAVPGRRAAIIAAAAAVSVLTDVPDWQPHVATAQQIAATGAPPLTLSNGVVNQVADAAGGASTNATSFTFSQPAYELFVNAWGSGAGTPGPLRIRLNWYEDNGLVLVDSKYYYLWPGTSSLGNMVCIKGPSRAQSLGMLFDNTFGTQFCNIRYSLFQRSHFYTTDDARSISFTNSGSATALTNSEVPSGLIGTGTASVASNGTFVQLLPLYQGQAQLYADTGSATSDLQVTIQNASNPNATGLGTRIWRARSNSTGQLATNIELPGYQCQVELKNLNAATFGVLYSLHTIPV